MIPINATTLRQVAILSGTASTSAAAAQNRNIEAIGTIAATMLDAYKVNTALRIEHFLAQACEESDAFRTMEEYATGAAYEGRADLGNNQPGDGPRFKGRGIFMLTGRANYRSMGITLRLDLIGHPELAADPVTALRVALVYWTSHNLSLDADKDDLIAVTRGINGGTLGLPTRRIYLARAKQAVAALIAQNLPQSVQVGDAVRPTIRLGSIGTDVDVAQAILSDLDVPITVNGEFDAQTAMAVKQFQMVKGLTVDGIVGPQTWGALYEADPVEGTREH